MKFDIKKRPSFDVLEVGYSYFYGLDTAPKESKFSTISAYRQDEVDSWLDQLYEVLGKAKVVYGDPDDDFCFGQFPEGPLDRDTHKALLIDIQPIEKKDCEHYPVRREANCSSCKHCGKTLKLTWEVIE